MPKVNRCTINLENQKVPCLDSTHVTKGKVLELDLPNCSLLFHAWLKSHHPAMECDPSQRQNKNQLHRFHD